MSNPVWEYKTFFLEPIDVHDTINALGSDGWRLHTCDPVIVGLSYGVLVVMDRLVMAPKGPTSLKDQPLPMEMKS